MAATGALALAGVAIGLSKIDYEQVPRVGILSSVFFVASLIHVPVGPSSVHLLLIGLMGLLLGWAVFPALAMALLLQAMLFGFGGVTSLGANIVNMAIPALPIYYLFARRLHSQTAPSKLFGLAFSAGVLGIVLSSLSVGITLYASGKEFIGAIGAIFIGHFPVMVIEGFITAAVVTFLYRVRPELLKSPLVSSGPKEMTRA